MTPRRGMAIVALGLLVTFTIADVAQARWRMVVFTGTRHRVGMLCDGPNREAINGSDYAGVGFTMCIDHVRNTSVLCDDNMECIGVVNYAGGLRPRPRMPETPESLSESGSGPGPSPDVYDQEVPLDPPTDGPIIIN